MPNDTVLEIQLGDREQGPVYAQVRDQIEARIRNQQLATGEQLPSPARLAQKLSVDAGEVQRAYYELERNGLLRKKTGKDFLGQDKVTYTVN
ncbi:MAG TPA: GntR family transcriptional regulator [Pyrinomonadaceae bacterium]|jgi:DNA-binding transcriptional regulator YhcF (GntR family)|nr:GntR family transcriptional regulator [Pyrinomonadaceae bacterium]